jgi:hypothetical protein
MTDKQIRLDEGNVQRGGAGQGPKTSKPEITPKGQGSNRSRGSLKPGDIIEMSIRYEVDLELTSGNAPDGTRFDAIQRSIKIVDAGGWRQRQ